MPTCGAHCSSACLPKCGARCCAYKATPCGANCSAACHPKCGPKCCAYYARMERRDRLERAFLRDPLYALPPECRAPLNQVKAFNLGLPRSGTTWFAALMRNLGLRALHCNSRVHCQGVESRRLVRPDGANASSPYLRKVLAEFDAFSDLPFYWLPRPALSAVGRPLFFVTRREVHEWMQSFCGKIVPIMKGSECGGPGAAPSSLLEYAQSLAGERSADGPCALAAARTGCRGADRAWFQLYDQHHARVRREFADVVTLDLGRLSAQTVVDVALRIGVPARCAETTRKLAAEHWLTRLNRAQAARVGGLNLDRLGFG